MKPLKTNRKELIIVHLGVKDIVSKRSSSEFTREVASVKADIESQLFDAGYRNTVFLYDMEHNFPHSEIGFICENKKRLDEVKQEINNINVKLEQPKKKEDKISNAITKVKASSSIVYYDNFKFSRMGYARQHDSNKIANFYNDSIFDNDYEWSD